MNGTVEPRVSRGLRDLLPDQMLARQSMIDTIRRVYELYGFVPLATPAIEYLDVLSGSAGQEAQQSIFRVTNPENEALGLRFDLTVPLARVIAQYADLPRPFRRYTIGEVAAMLNLSAHYLWQCVRATRDESFRRKRKVSLSTLRSLPVLDWFKQGREWMIAEEDLLRQLR